MRILRNTHDLISFLKENPNAAGCLADTGFLYAMAYDDDRLFSKANEVFDVLADCDFPIYANVISRMEFVDLIFRKQITLGAIRMYERMEASSNHKSLYNLLKNIRDQDTAHKKQEASYKIDENRLKRLRYELESSSGLAPWKDFCKEYVGEMLLNEWTIIEQDLNLKFIEVLEGHTSELFEQPLYWKDMVKVMGEQGLRGPDAMIVNLFSKSRFPLLITSDNDFETSFTDPFQKSDKAIYIL